LTQVDVGSQINKQHKKRGVAALKECAQSLWNPYVHTKNEQKTVKNEQDRESNLE